MNNIAIKNQGLKYLTNFTCDDREDMIVEDYREYLIGLEYFSNDFDDIAWENQGDYDDNRRQASDLLLILTNINKFNCEKDMEMCTVIYNEIKIKTINGNYFRSNLKFKTDKQNKEFKSTIIGLIFGLIVIPSDHTVCIVVKETLIGNIFNFLNEESERKESDMIIIYI